MECTKKLRNMSSKPIDFVSEFDPQQAADALNEHGFLFAQIIRETIRSGFDANKQAGWKLLGTEYPVTATDGSQTKIDLVLGHIHARNVHVCLECKRPNPKFKVWLFFDKQNPEFFIEEGKMASGQLYGHPIEYQQSISNRFPAKHFSVFNSYLEAATKISFDKKASNGETIEKALRQIIAGHTGLMEKIKGFEREVMSFYRSIPVMVTTAQLFEADFNANDISLETGMIEASCIKLLPLKFCAVDYHSDDSLSIPRRDTGFRKGDVATDIRFFQNRTVFIVHASSINDFLFWAGEHLTEHPS